MVTFVKINPDQDFWSSPFTGLIRINQYFTDAKPGPAWTDEDMAKIPTGYQEVYTMNIILIHQR